MSDKEKESPKTKTKEFGGPIGTLLLIFLLPLTLYYVNLACRKVTTIARFYLLIRHWYFTEGFKSIWKQCDQVIAPKTYHRFKLNLLDLNLSIVILCGTCVKDYTVLCPDISEPSMLPPHKTPSMFSEIFWLISLDFQDSRYSFATINRHWMYIYIERVMLGK